jgi:hypothetical protein
VTNGRSGISRAIGRVSAVLAELDYAQRRVLEIRTGVPMLSDKQRLRSRPVVEQLEALYTYDDPRLSGR